MREQSGTGCKSGHDIDGLASHVPEVDPARYIDEQARAAYEDALVRWPVLARLMNLVGE